MVSPCLWKSSLRFMWLHRWQTGLNFLAIALGVAMIIAVDLANESAAKAFDLTLNSVSGQISHQIVPNNTAIDEQLFVQLRIQQAINRSAPRVQASIKIGTESFTLLGLDPISEMSLRRHSQAFATMDYSDLLQRSNGLIMLKQTADRLGLKRGSAFNIHYRGQSLPVTLSAVLDSDSAAALEGIVFTDIAIAQHLLGRAGQLDSIDLQLSPAQAVMIGNWLPEAYRLVEASARNQALLAMSSAFTTNLSAMSLLALLVSALLIYNSMRFCALRRQMILGTYRALGVTQAELLQLLIVETLALACAASIAGTVLGVFLSQYLLQFVSQTINDLYFTLTVKHFLLSPVSIAKGIALGISVSLMATVVPTIAASRVPAITLQRRSTTETQALQRFDRLALIGLIGLLLAYLYSLLPGHSLIGGFIALAIMVTGYCLIVPAALSRGCQLLDQLLFQRLSITARLAIRGISAGISRTGIAVAALTIALATVIGVTIMIGSFRHSVEVWLVQSLRGDFFISIQGSSRQNQGTGIPESLVMQLRNLDGAGHVTSLRAFRSETDSGRLRTINITPFRAEKHAKMLEQVDNANARYAAGLGIFISEPLAYHRQLAAGDKLQLYTRHGPRAFTVLGIFRDYSSSRGVIRVPTQILNDNWNSIAINGVFIEAESLTSHEKLLAAIRKILAGHQAHYRLSSNRAIRDNTMAIFDRTFAITHVLRLLVLIVAFTGLLSALLALQLEKGREYAILRATGMIRRQIGLLILLQTTLLALFSALLALPLGLLLADRLIHVINRRAFGWSMEQIVPFEIIPQSLLLAISAALLAAIYPIWNLQKKSIAASLREE